MQELQEKAGKVEEIRKEMEKEEELSAKRRIEQEAEDIIKKEEPYD